MEDNKNKSMLPLIIVFLLFGLFIIFLPNIKNIFSDDTPDTVTNNQNKPQNNPDNPDNNDIKIYDYTNDLSISYDNIKISNFDLSNGLAFTLTNERQTNLSNTEKLFIELYDQNDLLLQRIMLYFDKVIAPNEKIQFSFNATNFSRITLVKKQTSDYPYVEKTMNDKNEYELVCANNKEQYTYYFNKNQQLNTIKYVLKEVKDGSSDYLSQALETKNKAIKLDMVDGIDATFQESLNGYDFVVIYDLDTIKYDDYKSSTIYPLYSELRVVSFEMNSQGFSCK